MRYAAVVGLLLGLLSTTSAKSVTLDPNPADFRIVEIPGQYTVYNDSSDWYIWQFAVSNPNASSSNPPSITHPFWQASAISFFLTNGQLTRANSYSLMFNSTVTPLFGAEHGLLIGPGQHSGNFYFPGNLASEFVVLLVALDNSSLL
jgi:hypothetical protein